MKSLIKILIILAIVVVGGYFALNKIAPDVLDGASDIEIINTDEQDPADDVYDLLIQLRGKSEIEFSEPVRDQFEWRSEDAEPKNMEGWAINSKDVPFEIINKERFFEDSGFEMDIYNIADGTIVSLSGYKKGEIVCTILQGFSGEFDEDDMPIEPYLSDLEINCGKLK